MTPLKEGNQGKAIRVQGDFTLLTLPAPCFYLREYRGGASQTLTPSLLSPFTILREYSDSTLAPSLKYILLKLTNTLTQT